MGPGWAGSPPRKKRRQKPPAELEPALPLPICKGCGAALEREPDRLRRRGTYCPECLAKRRAELGAELPRLGSARNGSAHTPVASSRRRLGNATQRAKQTAWEAEHPSEDNDPHYYLAEVAPRLSQLTITQIARATGMSTSSASKFRSGKQLPHPRHWKTLAELGIDSDGS